MKPEVEAKVTEALLSLWRPIVGCGFRGPDYSDDRQILIDEALHFDDELWEKLVIDIKQKLSGIAQIEVEYDSVSIYLPDVKDFSINFELNSFNGEDYNDVFDSEDLDGMSREEAIEYLSDIEELPSFDYVEVSAGTSVNSAVWIIEDDNFPDLLNSIAEGVQRTPDVFKETNKNVTIELQKKAEKQREIENNNRERKMEEERLLAEFASQVKSALMVAGWSGKYRIGRTYAFFLLSLQLTPFDECRYMGTTQDDVISKIDGLVSIANLYKSLKIDGNCHILNSAKDNLFNVRDKSAVWRDVSKQ